MHLNGYINAMLKSTPTAYIIYQMIRDLNNDVIDFEVLDYNPSFLKIIDSKEEMITNDKFKNFIIDMKTEMTKINESMKTSQHKRIIGYSDIYQNGLMLIYFIQVNTRL